MAQPRRSTIYLDPALHRAVRIKAAETDTRVSEQVNLAVRLLLAEDEADLKAFRTRAAEPSRAFETVLARLKRDGLL
ncbi:MAG: CopG family transcriptional regulator [Deltaproteobacteria bacterium]|nr:CopG family transcriptional regulator [Deltaproteobacteria bacterium]